GDLELPGELYLTTQVESSTRMSLRKSSFIVSFSASLVSMKRLDHGPDVTVLENRASVLPCSPHDNIHHGPRQVVGSNHLVGEERSQRRVDCAQEAVAEIRFLSRLHRVDVRGPED